MFALSGYSTYWMLIDKAHCALSVEHLGDQFRDCLAERVLKAANRLRFMARCVFHAPGSLLRILYLKMY